MREISHTKHTTHNKLIQHGHNLSQLQRLFFKNLKIQRSKISKKKDRYIEFVIYKSPWRIAIERT